MIIDSGVAAVVDHVALLVGSVEAARDRVAGLGIPAGPIEEFPGEGTRECYMGDPTLSGRLLLMQSGGPGPYDRAFRARGRGLHHLGLAVPDLDAYVAGLAGSGWFLLPQSLRTIRDTQTAWLARSGVPTLLEVAADSAWERRLGAQAVVLAIEVPVPATKSNLMVVLGATGLAASADGEVWLSLKGRRVRASDLAT